MRIKALTYHFIGFKKDIFTVQVVVCAFSHSKQTIPVILNTTQVFIVFYRWELSLETIKIDIIFDPRARRIQTGIQKAKKNITLLNKGSTIFTLLRVEIIQILTSNQKHISPIHINVQKSNPHHFCQKKKTKKKQEPPWRKNNPAPKT